MQENPVKLPPGIVEDQPPDEEALFGRRLGTTARVTWPWLKSKFGKQPPREEVSDRDYYNGKWGHLTIEVRPFDANGKWLENLNQEFTSDSLRAAREYGFELMRDLPHVDGFWVEARLDKYWPDKGSRDALRMMLLGRYERARHTPNVRGSAGRLAKTHLLVAGRHVPECNRMGRHASGFVGVDLNKYLRVEPQDRCERCDASALHRCERIRNDKRAKGEPVPPIVLRWLGESDQAKHEPNYATRYNLSNLDADVDAALDHMSDFDVNLNKSNISVTEPMMIRMRDLGQYDDLSGWLDLDSGSDEQDIRSFRGAGWAALAEKWKAPEQMPPIVIVEAPNMVAIADGRGRVNYATAMGWDEIPAVIVTPAHTPNHAAVHYVWLVDYRGVPLDTEGPYGPMSLARAEPFARIGAAKGEHDRVVSIGRDVMAPGFEILRRYRRGTGERVQ